VVYYEPPGQTVARAERLAQQAGLEVGIWIPVAVSAVSPPAPYALHADPNPFSGRTTIRFSEAAAGAPPAVQIYDAAGRLVRSLRPEDSGGGGDRIDWDGRDEAGDRLPSGVYFARLSGRTQAPACKIILVK
jgi:flagellar basal-body rod modification protein FlgD